MSVIPAPGSSPLARGLRNQRWRQRSATQDHPRSRGVYPPRTGTSSPTPGSSPLARGLLIVGSQVDRVVGIIPARAGFTHGAGAGGAAGGDHPRSRGVYAGSTEPPARGMWIIPARAGFTGCWMRGPGARWDHPRSRGVYQSGPQGAYHEGGSSPLARGLRRRRRDPGHPGRIIPARAGFTRSLREAQEGAWDHPRSRGVYFFDLVSDLVDMGSSPLARGLPMNPIITPAMTGIIPARAGFTRGCK